MRTFITQNKDSLLKAALTGASFYCAGKYITNQYIDHSRTEILDHLEDQDLSWFQHFKTNWFFRSKNFYVTQFPATPADQYQNASELLFWVLKYLGASQTNDIYGWDKAHHQLKRRLSHPQMVEVESLVGASLEEVFHSDLIKLAFAVPSDKRIDCEIWDATVHPIELYVTMDLEQWTAGELYIYLDNYQYVVHVYDMPGFFSKDNKEKFGNLYRTADYLTNGFIEKRSKFENCILLGKPLAISVVEPTSLEIKTPYHLIIKNPSIENKTPDQFIIRNLEHNLHHLWFKINSRNNTIPDEILDLYTIISISLDYLDLNKEIRNFKQNTYEKSNNRKSNKKSLNVIMKENDIPEEILFDRPISFFDRQIKIISRLIKYDEGKFGIEPTTIKWIWIEDINLNDDKVFECILKQKPLKEYPPNYNETSWRKIKLG